MTTNANAPPPDRRRILTMGAGIAAASAGLSCRAAREVAVAPEPVSEEERARLDELFTDLADESRSIEPISDAEHAARRLRLGELLGRSGFDAILMEGGATMSYLSGVTWGHSERLFGLVVVADGSHSWGQKTPRSPA